MLETAAAFFAFAFAFEVDESLKDWHGLLAHDSKDTLPKFGENTFADPSITSCVRDHDNTRHCGPCEIGKQHRLPSSSIPKEARRNNPLEPL
jgi:hypothetical protein